MDLTPLEALILGQMLADGMGQSDALDAIRILRLDPGDRGAEVDYLTGHLVTADTGRTTVPDRATFAAGTLRRGQWRGVPGGVVVRHAWNCPFHAEDPRVHARGVTCTCGLAQRDDRGPCTGFPSPDLLGRSKGWITSGPKPPDKGKPLSKSAKRRARRERVK